MRENNTANEAKSKCAKMNQLANRKRNRKYDIKLSWDKC